MKNKKLLALVVALVLILTIFAACDPKTNAVSVLANWADNLDEVYTVKTENNGLQLAFDKAGSEWGSAKKSLATVAAQLDGLTKLVMTVKMDNYSNNGPSNILVKIEFNDSDANPSKEVRFQISATEQTYEWDLTGVELTDALQMLIFVDPTCGISSGTVKFSKFEFNKGEIASSSIKLPATNVVNEYTSGTTFDFNKNWIDGGDNSYSFAKTGNTTTVSYVKWIGNTWAAAKVLVKNVQSFDYINIKVKGTAAKHALFKIEGGEGAVEKTITFDGTVQDLTLNFKDKTSRTGELTFILFAMEGSTVVESDKIEISLLEFSNTALVAEPVVPPTTNEFNTPWEATWTPANFKAEARYTVANGNEFSFTTGGWDQIQLPLSGDFSKFTTVTVNLTVSRDMPIIAKLDGINYESKIEGSTLIAGQTQYQLVFDLSTYTRAQMQSIPKLMFFVDWDATEAGTITVNSVVFSGLRVSELNTNNTIDLINSAVGTAEYQLTYNADGSLKVDFADKGEWAALGFALDTAINYGGYTKIVIEYSSTTISGKNILVKINGANETWENGIPANGKITVTLAAALNTTSRIYIDIFFAGAETVSSGDITITAIYLTK